jgi:hypothetical protein
MAARRRACISALTPPLILPAAASLIRRRFFLFFSLFFLPISTFGLQPSSRLICFLKIKTVILGSSSVIPLLLILAVEYLFLNFSTFKY